MARAHAQSQIARRGRALKKRAGGERRSGRDIIPFKFTDDFDRDKIQQRLCARGGIGQRGGFRYRWGKTRAGSSPVAHTKQMYGFSCDRPKSRYIKKVEEGIDLSQAPTDVSLLRSEVDLSLRRR